MPLSNEWKQEPYNGWPNWATWNMNLWLSNDEGDYRFIEMMKKRILEDYSDWNPELQVFVVDLSEAELYFIDWLKDEFGDRPTPDMDQIDLKDVDWAAIGEAWFSHG